MAKKKIRYGKKIMPVLQNIRSRADFYRYAVLAAVLFKHKVLRLLGLERRPKGRDGGIPGHAEPGC